MSKIQIILSPFFILGLLILLFSTVGGTAALGYLSRPVDAASHSAVLTPTVTISTTAELFLALVVYDLPPTPTPSATPAEYEAVDIQRENDVIDLIGQERANNGLALDPLTTDQQLVQSARRHSEDMATHNNTSHTGTDSSTAKERIEDAGYTPTWHGEIIAWGFPDAAGAVGWWMNSTTHRNIILGNDSRDLGVGYGAAADNFHHYWVVNFGRRGGTPDHNLVQCTIVTGDAARGSSISFWAPPPCP